MIEDRGQRRVTKIAGPRMDSTSFVWFRLPRPMRGCNTGEGLGREYDERVNPEQMKVEYTPALQECLRRPSTPRSSSARFQPSR